MAFCSNCGKQIKEDKKFCSNCGASTKEVSGSTKSNEKQARLVLSTSKSEGFLKRVPCYLVFFDDAVILAHLGKQRQKTEIENFRQDLKAQGKGFLKSTFEMIGFWKNYGDKYYSMHKQLILEEEPANTTIDYSGIVKFIFKAISRIASSDNSSSSQSQGTIQIKTNSGKYKFTHNYYDSNKQIKAILSGLFGKALKYRGGGFAITIGGNKNGIN